jgi:hypothetical protein
MSPPYHRDAPDFTSARGRDVKALGVALISSKEGRASEPRLRVAELPWNAFMKRHLRAHLLTGVFDPDGHLAKRARQQFILLRALAQVLCRRGNYAVTVLRQSEGDELAMVGTEYREDSDRIARAVRARHAPCFGPWRSHRSFEIDVAAYCGVALALARGLSFQGRRSRSQPPKIG